MSRQSEGGVKHIATNRKAQHDYFIEDRYEAGVALTGTEIKSVRAARQPARGLCRFAAARRGWLTSTSRPMTSATGRTMSRNASALLLHRQEIRKPQAKVSERGWTIVPLSMYLKDGRAKIEIALVRGKRLYDKRDAVAERDADRDLARALREYERE